ncbi:unnamed protein product [Arabis nemorensis]|uniref:Uncharacterized protein n=1 Tax=Arabis nemorensis TaxID=586526 RepID=A0A565CI99_9BRAS|nr:unnamed protein product [Arabis nemorensis]
MASSSQLQPEKNKVRVIWTKTMKSTMMSTSFGISSTTKFLHPSFLPKGLNLYLVQKESRYAGTVKQTKTRL